eukprot:3170823-Pleurochrysis_carterae.AAC.5
MALCKRTFMHAMHTCEQNLFREVNGGLWPSPGVGNSDITHTAERSGCGTNCSFAGCVPSIGKCK